MQWTIQAGRGSNILIRLSVPFDGPKPPPIANLGYDPAVAASARLSTDSYNVISQIIARAAQRGAFRADINSVFFFVHFP